VPTFPTFPSLDLSKLDLSKLDLSKLDLASLDPTKILAELRPILDRLPGAPVDADRVADVLRDAAYVVVGLGVLTVQQAQVRRRELVESLGSNPVVDLAERLPEQAAAVIGQAQELVKAARTEVLARLRAAA